MEPAVGFWSHPLVTLKVLRGHVILDRELNLVQACHTTDFKPMQKLFLTYIYLDVFIGFS